MNYHIKDVHIDNIVAGDVVEHQGRLKTVSPGDIRRGGFMGTSLWGDCHRLGTVPVKLVIIETPARQRSAT